MKEQSAITKPKWYVDSEERVLASSEVNKHHLIFPKTHYKGRKEQQYRGLAAFSQRMTIPSHKELHANVEPPPKASTVLMDSIIWNQSSMEGLDPLERLNYSINYLGYIAQSTNEQMIEESLTLIDNLKRQRTFVELGRVTLLSDK